MKITIPGNPISVNQLYRGRRFLTRDGEAAKFTYKSEAWSQWRKKPIGKGIPVSLEVIFYFPDARRHDIDNCLKGLLDSLTGVCWEDDSQITELHVWKYVDVKKPRVELSFSATPLSTVRRLDA